MKLKKENLQNFILVILLALLLFTPLGFHARVFVARILTFSPAVLEKEEQFTLPSYNWKLSNLSGETFDFTDAKGEVVLVNFWATWCPPCVAEMPSLQALYTDYGSKIKFILVAHDQRGKVKTFLNKTKYDFPIYFESSTNPNVLSPEYIPTTFIIDKKGKIVVEKTGSANWNSTTTRELIDNLIKE